jgi:hypothetical protein
MGVACLGSAIIYGSRLTFLSWNIIDPCSTSGHAVIHNIRIDIALRFLHRLKE